MTNYSLKTALDKFMFVRGFTVKKPTTKDPQHYVQQVDKITALHDSDLAALSDKYLPVFKRTLYSGIFKTLDASLSKPYGTIKRVDLINQFSAQELSFEYGSVNSSYYSTLLFRAILDGKVSGGYDFINHEYVDEGLLNNLLGVTLNLEQDGSVTYHVTCQGAHPALPANTPVKLQMMFLTVNLDDPLEAFSETHFHEIQTHTQESGNFMPPVARSIASDTFVLVRILVLEPDAKGVLKSKAKGAFDVLQICVKLF